MSGSSDSSSHAAPYSSVPGRPSFRAASLNAIAMVPLLSTDKAGAEVNSYSAQSFRALLGSLHRYAKTSGKGASAGRAATTVPPVVANKQEGMTEVELDQDEHDGSDLLLVVPNSQLTRPGDWRYDNTPLRSFHWSNGCQRMLCFDGRPYFGRMAHDRLLNASVGRDWIDLFPNRRTAAVVGILNVKDCPDIAAFQKAEAELQQWAQRYSAPPYEVTAHGRSFARDEVVQRLFVFDSFDEECQKRIDLTSKLRANMVAFPPSDDAHHHMMDLHLNIVLNDLAVAIFRQLETKIRDSDLTSKDKGAPAWNNRFNKPAGSDHDEPVNAKPNLSITQIASVVNPDNQLAAAVKEGGDKGSSKQKNTRTAIKAMTESAGRLMNVNKKKGAAPQLLTPLDDIWDYSELSPKDADAMKKRDVGRREKLAADLSLLAGSPIDAYERYTRAAELTKASHDPLWYAASLEGCAASFVAMAEAGGHCVDDYLENNFQLPEEMMVLASMTKDDKTKTLAVVDKTKTTLPAAVFALCEEALSITSRNPKLAPIHAELLLKLASYTAEIEDSHLRCRWGEEDGCYSGEAGEKPRWERTSVSKVNGQSLSKSKEGKEMLALNSLGRCQKWAELLHRAASTGALDPRTRADVAAACARMCLTGIRATRWGQPQRFPLPRKAAFFTVVAAESLSQCGEEESNAGTLWLAACQAYSRTGNKFDSGSHYGWATLRATTLHALSQQQDDSSSEAAAELLLALLSKISPDRAGDAEILERINSSDMDDDTPLGDNSIHSTGVIGMGQPIVEPEVPQTVASTFSKRTTSLAPRNFFQPEQKSSLLTVAQSKWTDDEAIPYIPLPLVDPNHIIAAVGGRGGALKDKAMDASLSRSLILLNCVLPKIQPFNCGLAQKRCIKLISDLRQELPTISSPLDDTQEEIFPIYGSNDKSLPPPLHIVTAKAVKSESHLLLERSKAFGFSGRETGAMATFFNPYDAKKKAEKKVQATLVAEGEERTVLIEFGSCLSVPLKVPCCQLEFEAKDKDRIKAPPLSFVVPPMAKNFSVHFPFIVLASPRGGELVTPEEGEFKEAKSVEESEATDQEDESEPDVFEVTGLRVACLNRSFFLPIIPKPEDEEETEGDKQVPDSAGVYQRSSQSTPKKPREERMKPNFEAIPPQPHLVVSFTESPTPIEDGTIVPVHLSDGEIFTIPTLRLINDFGPSGMGTMERLQILGVGLPGLPDEMLYDTDAAAAAREEDDLTESDDESSGFEQLMELDGLPPLKMKAICDKLSLAGINDKSTSKAGSTVVFQIAATHDMGNQLANGGNCRIRFRYRGPSPNATTEIWRKREVSLRIVRVKGPRISSLTFRSDLSWGSAYAELCKALAEQKIQLDSIVKPNPRTRHLHRQVSDLSVQTQNNLEEISSAFERVGIDQGVHVSGNDVVVLMAVANETNSTIILSNRLGLVGGFEGSPMPTVRVTSGVSVKIPVVIPRIDRIGAENSIKDIATELIARTALQWKSEVDKDSEQYAAANRRARQGRVRIPSRCLREIIAEHQAFVPRICKPPVSVTVSIAETGSGPAKQLVVSPGTTIDTFVNVENADWVPAEIASKCRITLEFCCARKGGQDSSGQYLWFGRVRRSVRADEPDKKHRARITFLGCGAWVISACARVSMDGSGAEETWWAPQAENVIVEKLNFEDSFRSLVS